MGLFERLLIELSLVRVQVGEPNTSNLGRCEFMHRDSGGALSRRYRPPRNAGGLTITMSFEATAISERQNGPETFHEPSSAQPKPMAEGLGRRVVKLQMALHNVPLPSREVSRFTPEGPSENLSETRKMAAIRWRIGGAPVMRSFNSSAI